LSRLHAVALLAIVIPCSGIVSAVSAQPAQISVEDCLAFEIADTNLFCCYAFTLCVTNASLPDITGVSLTLQNGSQCAPPGSPDGWDWSRNASTIDWEADDPIEAIGQQETLCGFTFASVDIITVIDVVLTNFGNPVYTTTLTLECDEDCGVTPIEPGTWGRIKSIYTD
jgi:hypothetical protein